MNDTRHWQDVANAIDRRLAELGWSQMDLVRQSGVSDATVRRLQRGGGDGGFRSSSLAEVSKALGWQPEALARVSRGEEAPKTVDYLDRAALVRQIRKLRADVDDLEDMVRRSTPTYAP